jgi:NAD(P)-dependent dehydrogenase (short-subunit alcohol dehydrogenase family)
MSTQKVALITGANRGIGFETAKQLGEQGIVVVLTARQLADAQQAAATLQAAGIQAHGLQLDVTNAAQRGAVVQYLADTFGKLDILVNNAGVAPKESLFVPRTVDVGPEEFEYVFGTNLFSLVYLTHDVLPLLRKSPAGRIVNVSSTLGSLAMHAEVPSPWASVRVLSYNASKAALNMFTIHLAAELAETGIKVNSAHPGWVKTELGGGDMADLTVEEGAKTSVALALLGPDGPSGQFIHLGQTMPW